MNAAETTRSRAGALPGEEALSGEDIPSRGASVDEVRIVVPIYGAAEDLERCLESVGRNSDLDRHGLVLVLDGPQASDVNSLVEEFANRFKATRVVTLPRRSGFAAAVNAGIALESYAESGNGRPGSPSPDVVLLNTDTIVPRGWLDRLIDAARSRPDVATVTPLSNDATLCSVPRAWRHNLLPAGHDVESLAALVERVSRREYRVLPTGVGFCLYLRRSALDVLGGFDVARYGAGYGEENDYCLRAVAKGFVNVVDDATFVYHRGGASFGQAARRLRRIAARRLAREFPDYEREVASFMHSDPLAPIRRRILDELERDSSSHRGTRSDSTSTPGPTATRPDPADE